MGYLGPGKPGPWARKGTFLLSEHVGRGFPEVPRRSGPRPRGRTPGTSCLKRGGLQGSGETHHQQQAATSSPAFREHPLCPVEHPLCLVDHPLCPVERTLCPGVLTTRSPALMSPATGTARVPSLFFLSCHRAVLGPCPPCLLSTQLSWVPLSGPVTVHARTGRLPSPGPVSRNRGGQMIGPGGEPLRWLWDLGQVTSPVGWGGVSP